MITQLLLNHTLHLALMLISIVVIGYSVNALMQIRKHTAGSKFEGNWNVILLCVTVFLLGYAAVLYLFLATEMELMMWPHLVIAIVFLAEAAFVLYVLNTMQNMLKGRSMSLSNIKILRAKQGELAK